MEKEKTSSETRYSKQPIIESFFSLSADRKWIIHKTIVTDIKPVGYVNMVLAGEKKA